MSNQKTSEVEKYNSDSSNSHDSEREEDFMPALPPHMVNQAERTDSKHSVESLFSLKNLDETNTHKINLFSPSAEGVLKLENNCITNTKESIISTQSVLSSDVEDDEEDMYLPALPPHLLNKSGNVGCIEGKSHRIIGPTLPVGFVPPLVSDTFHHEDSDNEDDDCLVGPMPSTEKANIEEYKIREFEYRAKQMKEKLKGTGSEQPLERESWMTELPKDRGPVNLLGLGPRQFLKKTPVEKGDCTIWTDTPEDRVKRAKLENVDEEQELTAAEIAAKRRDEKIAKVVEKYNEDKRAKPLIDLHSEKLKNAPKLAGPKERKPFNREEDLGINKFDEAQKASIIKKSRQLNDRFSSGKAKFL